jgi:hypothetical protein
MYKHCCVAKAEIRNCGSSSGYDSFLFTTDLRKFYRKKSWLLTVLRIREVYPGSRILIFTHPGSRIQK